MTEKTTMVTSKDNACVNTDKKTFLDTEERGCDTFPLGSLPSDNVPCRCETKLCKKKYRS